MAAFGGLILTNKGRALQAKAQAGATLHFNRIGIGDGNLGSQQISGLNALISEKKSLDITKLKTQSGDKAIVGGVLSNEDVTVGFYFREIGVFAQDPNEGEILYCYANSGAGAEYIPVGGGPDIVQKNIDIITLIGNAANVAATIASGIYASQQDLTDYINATDIDLATKAPLASPAFTDIPTAPTAPTATNTNQIATAALVHAVVDLAIAGLINGAPGALDALNELAAAMGNDPNFATTMTNALAQKLNASAYTAADVLAKLKTVDGAGSLLDMDLLDGLHAASFARTAGSMTAAQLNNNTTLESGMYTSNDGTGIGLGAGWWHVIHMKHHDQNGYAAQIAVGLNADFGKMYLRQANGVTWGAWKGVGGVDYFAMTNNVQSYGNAANVTVAANSFIDLMTVNGKGLLSEFLAAMSNSVGSYNSLGFSLVVDGVEMFLHTNVSGVSIHPVFAGDSFYGSSTTAQITQFNGPLKSNTSLTVRVRNNHAASTVVINAQELAVRLAIMMV